MAIDNLHTEFQFLIGMVLGSLITRWFRDIIVSIPYRYGIGKMMMKKLSAEDKVSIPYRYGIGYENWK